eukprot:COSAG02_NODE_4093_length_5795_cov_3.111482_3_plen_133_part_00
MKLGTEEGSDSTYEDCKMEVFIANTDDMCNVNDINKPLISGGCKALMGENLAKTIADGITAGFPEPLTSALKMGLNSVLNKLIEGSAEWDQQHREMELPSCCPNATILSVLGILLPVANSFSVRSRISVAVV